MRMKINRYNVSWLAAGWAIAFAIMSFYWALGGTIGMSTLGSTVEDASKSTVFVAIIWLTGFMKLVAAFFALSALHKWGERIPPIIRLIGLFSIGVICFTYGFLNMAVRAIMAVGIISTPDSMHTSAAQWHLLLWNPWWLIGGILFILTAHYFYSSEFKSDNKKI